MISAISRRLVNQSENIVSISDFLIARTENPFQSYDVAIKSKNFVNSDVAVICIIEVFKF